MGSCYLPRSILGAALAVLIGGPGVARAQSAPPPLPKYDVSLLGGWGGVRAVDARYNTWDGIRVAAVEIGRYWTDHIKTEALLQTATVARIFDGDPQASLVPGIPRPVFRYSEVRIAVSGLALQLQYQFLRNQWFHPFLGAGVSLDRERVQREFPEQTVSLSPVGGSSSWVVVPREVMPARIDWQARPVITGGFKAYVAQRAFLRTDVALAFATGEFGTARWHVGAGFDF